jgi:Clostridium epsilon toxin ETX/Bacillus mosquitocidal toxin MTX2
MALKSGSIIGVNEFLSVDDYIESPNGCFFAIMQENGNFVVYRGTRDDQRAELWASNTYGPPGKFFAIMQDDGNFVVYRRTPDDKQEPWWATGRHEPQGKFFAIMQDDGAFVVYRGTRDDQRAALWDTNAVDPVVGYEISSIDYDVNAAKILQSGPAELYRQIVRNDTKETQSSTISGSKSVAETSGWSDSLAVKVGVSTSFKAGVPFIADGKVTVSLEVTNTYTWNGSTTQTKTWGFSTPVSVPPHTVIVCLVSATISTIAVPYTEKGTITFKSGTKMSRRILGTYTGTTSHDLTVTFLQRDPVTSHILSSTQALKATSS